jgi:hypothetical protein
MSAELIEVMNFHKDGVSYFSTMEDNVFNKKTASSKKKTIGYLSQLYGFQEDDLSFKALEEYWQKVEEDEKPLLAFVYAINRDYLLKESISFVKSVPDNQKAPVEGFEDNIKHHHPDRFTPKTLRSVAQNIASSWKQANYIEGKRKNIRKQQTPSYRIVAFAFLMAYLDGQRGEYMLDHPSVKCLDVNKQELLGLVKSAADRDLVRFNQSGSTMVISFENNLQNISHG